MEWHVKWAGICFKLQDQLPLEAGSAIGIAFSLGFSRSPRDLLQRLNGSQHFTGINYISNLTRLMNCLEPWAGVPAVIDLKLALCSISGYQSDALGVSFAEFFNYRLALKADVINTLCGRWWEVMVKLSSMGVATIKGSMEHEIRSNFNTEYSRAQGAFDHLFVMKLTIGQFIDALDLVGLGRLSLEVRNAALLGSSSGSASSSSYSTSSASVVNNIIVNPAATTAPAAHQVTAMAVDSLAVVVASRLRLFDPSDRLEDEAYLIVRVEFCEEEHAHKDLRFRAVKLVKGYAKAKKEQDTLMDEDVANQGGDESKIKHIYSVWSFRAHCSPEQKQIKSRTKERGGGGGGSSGGGGKKQLEEVA